jgi:squalene-hopene/tetraprenyl-beta-curcumene cyclase
LAYRDLDQMNTKAAKRGLHFLVAEQREDGGWGAAPCGKVSSVEETAVALEALLASPHEESTQLVLQTGLEWLIAATENDRHQESTPIGFYFARLWYYERLYPLVFTVSALRRAVHAYQPEA